MFVSPGIAIIKREFLSGLRSGKPFLFLALLMLVMIGGLVFIMGVLFPEYARFSGRGIRAQDIRALFMVYAFGLYLSAVLLVPPLAGVSICTEKQQDSYDLLLMTYIRPHSLALAKLLNVLGIYALVTVATLPVAGVFFFLVGIDWIQFVQSITVIALSALSCAVIGLLCSAWFYRTLPAIITTYVVGFVLHGGQVLALALLAETVLRRTWVRNMFGSWGEEYVLSLCPLAALAMIGDSYKAATITLMSIGYHGIVIMLGMVLLLLILRRPPRPMKINEDKPIDDQAELKARRRKFPYYLLDPRRRRPLIPDDRNPLLSKELQTGLLGRGSFAVRIFYGFTLFCVFVSFFTIVSSGYRIINYARYIAWPIYIDTLFILVVTPALIATAIAKEHEWGNLDMLRTTLLRPGQIVAGKFRTALYTALLPLAGALLGSLPLFLLSHNKPAAWLGLVSGLGNMAVCVLFVLSLTLLITVQCKRSIAGLMLGYAAGVGALILLPGFLFMLWMFLTGFNNMPDEVAGTILFTSPLAAQLFNIEEFDNYNEHSLTSAYWMLNTAFFLVVSAVLLFAAKVRFTRYIRWGAG